VSSRSNNSTRNIETHFSTGRSGETIAQNNGAFAA
jgi:hypothetical protein